MFEAINTLIEKEDWKLQSWRERYGSKGKFWAAVGPQEGVIDGIRDISTGPDIPSIELSSFFYKAGVWLPVANEDTLEGALNRLNEKLLPIYKSNIWQSAVYDAFTRILEVSDQSYGLTIAVDKNDSSLLGPTSTGN
jgi:hypothetical protein